MESNDGQTDQTVVSVREPLIPLRRVVEFDSEVASSTASEKSDHEQSERLTDSAWREGLLLPPTWTVQQMKHYIAEYGTRVIDAINKEGEPFYWDAIKDGHYTCANVILDYAKEDRIFVTFRGPNGDLLSWAIENTSTPHVKFILKKLTEKYTSVKETCDLLKLHFSVLIDRFPKLIGGMLKEDRFTVDYAELRVPLSLFGKDGDSPVAMTIDRCLDSWKYLNMSDARKFWMEKSDYAPEKFINIADVQVNAVAKFFCIDSDDMLNATQNYEHIFDHAVDALLDRKSKTGSVFRFWRRMDLVEIYESETLKAFADWWYDSYSSIYFKGVMVDVFAAFAFTCFALLYEHKLVAIMLISVSFLVCAVGVIFYFSFLRSCLVLLELVLLIFVSSVGHRTELFAFLTSTGCVLYWLVLFRFFRPFEHLGHFVSMVHYALVDTLPFVFLGLLLLLGYSTAFVVLFDDSQDEIDENERDFNSFPHTFETLYYSSLGNFEPKMVHSSNGFLEVWRSILFFFFIFIVPIVLMSLLIAILTDTYDRVRSKEQAELRKCRMQVIASCRFCKKLAAEFVNWFRDLIRMLNDAKPFRDLIRMLNDAKPFRDRFPQTVRHVARWNPKMIGILEPPIFSLFRQQRLYFHFLVQKDNKEGSREEEWHGRLVAIERPVKAEMQEHKKVLEKQLSDLGQKIESLTVKNQFGNMEERIGNIEEEMSHLKKVTDQILQIIKKPEATSS